jgi:hypothetical protein
MKQIERAINQATNDPSKSEAANEAIETVIPLIKDLVAFNKDFGNTPGVLLV